MREEMIGKNNDMLNTIIITRVTYSFENKPPESLELIKRMAVVHRRDAAKRLNKSPRFIILLMSKTGTKTQR
jgi:hypothetical protein